MTGIKKYLQIYLSGEKLISIFVDLDNIVKEQRDHSYDAQKQSAVFTH